MGRIIGIDFGTTNSLVSYIEGDKPKIIPNDYNENMTPSVVGQLYIGEYTVGKVPKRQYILKPRETIIEIKRLIGRNKEVVMGDIKYSPEQISSIIIKKLKEYAEKYIGEQVEYAVITVPASFNDLQRKSIIQAGELAGLKIIGIINEPTAAALAYGINQFEGNKKILIYDLGGGTLDVTVANIGENIIDIRASRGNNKLGGKDFDKRIIDFIVDDFFYKYGIDLRADKQAMARIKEAAEIAKIELSSVSATDIILPFIHSDEYRGPISINMKLTREKLKQLIGDLVYSSEKTIMDALDGAGYKIEDIDMVLPVGGSTNISCIKDLLKKLFKSKIKFCINSDEAVALGAAIYGEIKSKERTTKNKVAIFDRCSYSIGISIAVKDSQGRIVNGIFDPIIVKDSRIPCVKTRTYYTLYNNQTTTEIRVYQGDSEFVDDNLLIDMFLIKDIPKGPAGKEKIEISFFYDSNGILDVAAKILSNGHMIKKTMNTFKTDKFIQDFEEKFKYSNWEKSKLAYIAKDTIWICENIIKDLKYIDAIKAENLLKSLKKAIIINDIDLITKYESELLNLISNAS